MHRPSLRPCAALAVLLSSSLAWPAPASAPVQVPPLSRGESVQAPAAVDCGQARSVARAWNERILDAIRIDAPRPTVQARNLFHLSLAMYDTWAAYDQRAQPHLVDESVAAQGQGTSHRAQAISYAAYRVLVNRYAGSPGAVASLASFQACMQQLGLDPAVTTTEGTSAAAVGNRVAAAIIAHGLQDGSNQQGSYIPPVQYFPVNAPMLVILPGTGGLADVNAWQPLIPPGAPGVQSFLTPHWRDVRTFALQRSAPGVMYHDPGVPPKLGGNGDARVKADILEVIRFSSQLDPADTVLVNRSPRVIGNNPLGSNAGSGHPTNPATAQPYADNFVRRGDLSRVLAEFWADGPRSTTPPGHWNEIANAVTDHPATTQQIGGRGDPVDDLEWDVKLYFVLNGALHDNAIATWDVKRSYNASRPITLIREMATLGQSSDPAQPHYSANGLPLAAGLVELVTAQSSAPGERHAHLAAHIGKIAIRAWAGHPANPATQAGGAAWILGERWIPYQQRNFVTPPFPGYTSGHSGFSRAAAEVLTAYTGSAYFPGGLGEALASTAGDGFRLGFEFGPSAPLRLQWATYQDAADEAGVSRLYGGIHPAYDDYPGRVLGHAVGTAAIRRAFALYGNASAPAAPVPVAPGAWRWLLALMLLALGMLALRRA